MIGVVSRPEQRAVVEEFFQLFKTPWEFFQEGRAYDVIIVAGGEIPHAEAKLLLVFGLEVRRDDSQRGIAGRTPREKIALRHRDVRVPVYGGALVFNTTGAGKACLESNEGVVGIRFESESGGVLRLGYDLFQEVQWLLSTGQPIENAHCPALDLHIAMLRDWMLEAGVSFVEIPPAPAGKQFMVSLTHDIDFIGIRDHKFDHTMWGFLYRSSVVALRDFARGRISFAKLLKIWRAVASLPFVYLGWAKDFWIPFDWFLEVEKNLPATYYFIPFKNRAGDKVTTSHADRRATKYDVTDLGDWTKRLQDAGNELGLHGIDAWHSVEQGRVESGRIAAAAGPGAMGIRMHWLLRDENTYRVLEEAGFAYDSTDGYNETIGYRAGTTQAFRPLGRSRLLELPMHIQDGALFYANRLDLSEDEAWARCGRMIDDAKKSGGVLTLLWHDRSHGPERFWGDFYARLVGELRTMNVWFGSAGQVVEWFRKRREAVFERDGDGNGHARIKLRSGSKDSLPSLALRVHSPATTGGQLKPVDVPWNGESELRVEDLLRRSGGANQHVMSR